MICGMSMKLSCFDLSWTFMSVHTWMAEFVLFWGDATMFVSACDLKTLTCCMSEITSGGLVFQLFVADLVDFCQNHCQNEWMFPMNMNICLLSGNQHDQMHCCTCFVRWRPHGSECWAAEVRNPNGQFSASCSNYQKMDFLILLEKFSNNFIANPRTYAGRIIFFGLWALIDPTLTPWAWANRAI